jgi:VanZ family protein
VAAWAALILVATTVHVPDVVLRTPVSWLDKLAHGTLYLVLGWLTGAAMCAAGRCTARAGFVALAVAAAFAALDEAHQAWLPGRVPSVGDWAADVIGATIGLAVGIWVWSRSTTEK